ncbi:MAG: zinc-ribbon domain-containing protein [Candidatus Hodarchaeota archaeon]
MELPEHMVYKYLDELRNLRYKRNAIFERDIGAAHESLKNYLSMANFLKLYIERFKKRRTALPGVIRALKFCNRKIREIRKTLPNLKTMKAYSNIRLKSIEESIEKRVRARRIEPHFFVTISELVCTCCNRENPSDARFCIRCGRALLQGL